MTDYSALYDVNPQESAEAVNIAAHPGGGTMILNVASGEGLVEDIFEAQLRGLEIAYKEPIGRVLASLANRLDDLGIEKSANLVDGILEKFAAESGGSTSSGEVGGEDLGSDAFEFMDEPDEESSDPREMLRIVNLDVERMLDLMHVNFSANNDYSSDKMKVEFLVGEIKGGLANKDFVQASKGAVNLLAGLNQMRSAWLGANPEELFTTREDFTEFSNIASKVSKLLNRLSAVVKSQPKSRARTVNQANKERLLNQMAQAENLGKALNISLMRASNKITDPHKKKAFNDAVLQLWKAHPELTNYEQVKEQIEKMTEISEQESAEYSAWISEIMKGLTAVKEGISARLQSGAF